MSENIFLQPHNLLGQFLQLSALKRLALMFLLGILCLSYPSYLTWQQYQNVERQSEQLTQLELALQHQQRLLASLKHKQQQQSLTPEIAAQLAKINQGLQQPVAKGHILLSQWRFEERPILQLQVESQFSELVAFLNQFLSSYPMGLLNIEIEKNIGNQNTVLSNVLLQLEQESEVSK